MDVSFEALGILAVLLPGFVSSAILDHVVVRKPKDAFGKLTEALVFSFLIYASLAAVIGNPAAGLPADASSISQAVSLSLNRYFVVGALVLSIVLPLALGFLLTTDLHMRLLRLVRVSNKTARETTWLDVFSEQRRYLIVNLSGGRRVFGWPQYYSNDRDEGLLYLFDPAWVNDDGSYTDLDIHGLFLVEAGSIESIEFTNITDRNARPQTEQESPS